MTEISPTRFDYSKPLIGRIWILGDDIDTDLIIPSRVLTEANPHKQMAACLENILPNFAKDVQPGDIIIAGKNFGCGSSREEAVFILKELGIAAVIAKSFARIFYRNMINLGLPPIEISTLVIDGNLTITNLGKIGEKIRLDVFEGRILDVSGNLLTRFSVFPEFIQKYLQIGGAIPYLKKNLHTSINPSCDK
jgi:3-isopropylmalate dehydratase small subunit